MKRVSWRRIGDVNAGDGILPRNIPTEGAISSLRIWATPSHREERQQVSPYM